MNLQSINGGAQTSAALLANRHDHRRGGVARQPDRRLLAGSIDAGVDDPPEDLELVKAGFTALVDLAGQKLPPANTGVIMSRAYLNANRDAVRAYVDSLTIAPVKMKADKQGGD